MLPLLIVAGAMAAASSIMGGFSANQAGQANKNIADYNALVAMQNAKMAKEKAKWDAARFEDKMNQFFGTQRAMMGASGFEIDSGSSFDVQYTSRYFGELDEATILYEGEIEARKWMIEGTNATMQGQLAQQQGKNAMYASFFQAGSSLLSSFAGGMKATGPAAGYAIQSGVSHS
jgi:hypothetical protein